MTDVLREVERPSPVGQGLAVVTGASSGIGDATAFALLRAGWTVFGISRRPPRASHPRFLWHGADLLDDGAPHAIEAALPEASRAIVHAAGVQRSAHLGCLDPAALAEMWALQVDAPARLGCPSITVGRRRLGVGDVGHEVGRAQRCWAGPRARSAGGGVGGDGHCAAALLALRKHAHGSNPRRTGSRWARSAQARAA